MRWNGLSRCVLCCTRLPAWVFSFSFSFFIFIFFSFLFSVSPFPGFGLCFVNVCMCGVGWLVVCFLFFFLVSSFGVGYILFLSVQPAQNRRRMDVSNSLEETFHITADPTVSYLPLILHR